MTILEKIIEEKYKEVANQQNLVSVKALEKRAGFAKPVISMRMALQNEGSSGIIAEFKRRSPSKGTINNKARVEEVTKGYVEAGAAALSVLTDRPFFGGSAVDLIAARELNQVPILRKDFLVDEYQIFEAKAMGADVILLIAAALNHKQVKTMATRAKQLGLEILFEVHTLEELDKLVDEVDMVGVNNRNLKDFKVDIQHSLELARHIPARFLKISESGLDKAETILKFREQGFKGFLIGETFMKEENPALACGNFIRSLSNS